MNRLRPKKPKGQKRIAVTEWILNFCSEVCEQLPTNNKAAKGDRIVNETIYVAPFLNKSQYYDEFCATSDLAACVSAATFCRALRDLPNVRMLRCKGDHAGCSVCILSAEMLAQRGGKKLSKAQREVKSEDKFELLVMVNRFVILLQVVTRYRRRHLNKQTGERNNMSRNRTKAINLIDMMGQPQVFWVMSDGMTERKGALPRYKMSTKKQQANTIGEFMPRRKEPFY